MNDSVDRFMRFTRQVTVERINKSIQATGGRLAFNIRNQLTKELDKFFVDLSRQIPLIKNTEPLWAQENQDLPWRELSALYVKGKKQGNDDFFMYSSLQRLQKKNSKAKRQPPSDRSLVQTIRNLRSPQQYFGEVTVRVVSDVNETGGRRRYPRGAIVGSVKVGGRLIADNIEPVTIVVSWAPRLEGVDVDERGAVERMLPDRYKMRAKLMNKADAYRNLVGARLKWFEKNRVNDIIDKAIARNRP